MLRADGRMNPDGVRDYELLVPAPGRGADPRALRRRARAAYAEADAWRATVRGGRPVTEASEAAETAQLGRRNDRILLWAVGAYIVILSA